MLLSIFIDEKLGNRKKRLLLEVMSELLEVDPVFFYLENGNQLKNWGRRKECDRDIENENRKL
jgi:hypothetical protein